MSPLQSKIDMLKNQITKGTPLIQISMYNEFGNAIIKIQKFFGSL